MVSRAHPLEVEGLSSMESNSSEKESNGPGPALSVIDEDQPGTNIIGTVTSTYGTSKVLAGMHQETKLRGLCDVVFEVEGEECPAHKAALGAVSDVFTAMFTCGMRESISKEVPIKIPLGPEVNLTVFRDMLTFVYLGRVPVTHDSCRALVRLGGMYQVTGLVDAVETFLIRRLSVKNCVQEWYYAADNMLPKLQQASLESICFHLQELHSTPSISSCSRTLIEEVLKSGSGNVVAKLKALGSWIFGDEVNRKTLCDSLLRMLLPLHLSDRAKSLKAGIQLVRLSAFSEIARFILCDLLQKETRRPEYSIRVNKSDIDWGAKDLKVGERRTLIEISKEVRGVLKNKRGHQSNWTDSPDGSFRVCLYVSSNFRSESNRSLTVFLVSHILDPAKKDEGMELSFRVEILHKVGDERRMFSKQLTKKLTNKTNIHGFPAFIPLDVLKKREGLYNWERDSVRLNVLLYRAS